jgi:hypothetical protein
MAGLASRQMAKLISLETYTRGWCRGPESNWLRPPFQGGALPMSYPGLQPFNFRDRETVCQFAGEIFFGRSNFTFAPQSWANTKDSARAIARILSS